MPKGIYDRSKMKRPKGWEKRKAELGCKQWGEDDLGTLLAIMRAAMDVKRTMQNRSTVGERDHVVSHLYTLLDELEGG